MSRLSEHKPHVAGIPHKHLSKKVFSVSIALTRNPTKAEMGKVIDAILQQDFLPDYIYFERDARLNEKAPLPLTKLAPEKDFELVCSLNIETRKGKGRESDLLRVKYAPEDRNPKVMDKPRINISSTNDLWLEKTFYQAYLRKTSKAIKGIIDALPVEHIILLHKDYIEVPPEITALMETAEDLVEAR